MLQWQCEFLIVVDLYLCAGIPDYKGICMEIWYFMYGRDVGSLNMYWQDQTIRELVWTKRGTHGPQWKYGQVLIFLKSLNI